MKPPTLTEHQNGMSDQGKRIALDTINPKLSKFFFNNAVHQNEGGDSDAPALLGPLSRHAASRGES